MTPIRRRPGNLLRSWLRVLWRQPLWAIPFALFFGTLYGSAFLSYWKAYQVSVVFAYSIGHALWITAQFIEPRVSAPGDEEDPRRRLTIGGWYVVMAMIGSYTAAFIVHLTLIPGFLGTGRDWLTSGLFSVLFVGMFTGINFARVFYRQAVDRARAVELTRAELAQAELRALRAQIHPHFLFNALNSIAALIAVNPAAAEETTTQLAEAFRYTLRASERERVRLGDELEFVRTVLAIEHTRFGDRLRVVEEIAPDTEAIEVPSLLLQPLVENAIRHGIASRPEGGTVRIAARREGDRLIVTVEDDGPGMRDDSPARGEGFGLHSVRERIRIAGPPHALDIESSPGAGTRVRLILPIPAERASEPPANSGGPR
jgi:signal transduction histidine kinase